MVPSPGKLVAALVTSVVLASSADAGSPWVSATEGGDAELARRTYEENMTHGDNYAVAAAGDEISLATRKARVRRAVLAYESAAQARPEMAEPHYRAGMTLFTYYLDCDLQTQLCNRMTTPQAEAERVLRHFDAFEQLAPRDPRIDFDYLFQKALLETKVNRPADAVETYEKILGSLSYAPARGLVLSNLAETYMMLGDLDRAIEGYREATRLRPDSSFLYGLAVALDRDEQRAEAREILRTLGVDALQSFEQHLMNGQSFFVPDAEKFYYLALAYESLGYPREALALWDLFITSGIYPEFQARARANRAALAARQAKKSP